MPRKSASIAATRSPGPRVITLTERLMRRPRQKGRTSVRPLPSGGATARPGDRLKHVHSGRSHDPPREEAHPAVAVTGLRKPRRRGSADERQPAQLPADPAAAQVVVALGVLDPADGEPRPGERPQGGVERVYV